MKGVYLLYTLYLGQLRSLYNMSRNAEHLENNIGTLIQLMITVLLDDPIICDLPIKVINIDEFLSMMGSSTT